MNKLLLILAILITNFSVKSQQRRFKEIKFNFTGDCLNIGESTLIEAEVTNYTDEVFYLNLDNLLFGINFYDKEGKPLFPNKKINIIEEPKKPEDKFILVKPKSKIKIKLKTHVFGMFDFKPNTEYTLVSNYYNIQNYKWKKKATLKGVVHANLFKFKVCK